MLALHHWEKDMTSLLFHLGGVLLCGIRVFPDDYDISFKSKCRNDLKFFLFYFGELFESWANISESSPKLG